MIITFPQLTHPETTDNSVKDAPVLMVGDKVVKKVYIGDTLVYDNECVTNPVVGKFEQDVHYTDLLKDKTQMSFRYVQFVNESQPSCFVEHSKPIAVQDKNGLKLLPNKTPGVPFTVNGVTYHPTGTIRSLTTDRIFNCRDTGGKPTTDGRMTKYNMLIRSAHLDDATPAELANLKQECNVMAELDFRKSTETYRSEKVGQYHPYGSGVTYFGPEYDAKGNPTYKYSFAPYDLAFANLPALLDACLSIWRKGGCIHCHCRSGADRTGIFCYLIEALCGVEPSECVKDFELTTLSSVINGHYIDDVKWLRRVNTTLSTLGSTLQSRVRKWFLNQGIKSTTLDEIASLLTTVPSASPSGTSTVPDASASVSPIHIAFWNIGHFSCGVSTTTKLTSDPDHAKRDAYLSAMQAVGGGTMPPIFGIAEWADQFTKDGQVAQDVLFPGYHRVAGQSNLGYSYNNLFLRDLTPIDSGEVRLYNPGGEAVRTYVWAKVIIQGKEVLIVSTHVAHWSSTRLKTKEDVHYKSRKPQFDQLAELIKAHKYVIIMADWNTTPGSIYRAKYTYGDNTFWGYGWGHPDPKILKWPNDGYHDLGLNYAFGSPTEQGVKNAYHVDNILVKGFKITEVYESNTDKKLSDHPAIGCVAEFE